MGSSGGLGWNPAGALPFRMRAHHRYLHAFSGFEGVFGHLVCSHIGHPLGWNPAGALPFRVRASMLLAVSKACLGTSSAATLATPWAGTLLGLCRFACVPTIGTSMLLAVSKVLFGSSAATLATPWAGILLGLCRFACVPTTCTSMLLAVSKVLFGHLVCSHNSSPLGLEACWGSAVSHACPPPVYLHAFSGFEGAVWAPRLQPFRMCAHHLYLHAFNGFEGAVWAPVCRLESMGLCRFACVPTIGTSMLLAVSKVLFGHLVDLQPPWRAFGLKSCWGSAVSHACPPPAPPCF